MCLITRPRAARRTIGTGKPPGRQGASTPHTRDSRRAYRRQTAGGGAAQPRREARQLAVDWSGSGRPRRGYRTFKATNPPPPRRRGTLSRVPSLSRVCAEKISASPFPDSPASLTSGTISRQLRDAGEPRAAGCSSTPPPIPSRSVLCPRCHPFHGQPFCCFCFFRNPIWMSACAICWMIDGFSLDAA